MCTNDRWCRTRARPVARPGGLGIQVHAAAHTPTPVPAGHPLPGGIFPGAHAHGMGPFNVATLPAFLAWFGGSGYLLTSELRWLALPAISLSIVIGLLGAAIVFWLITSSRLYTFAGFR